MTDVAKKIVMMMSEQGVAGLPRNYELFYEAVTGTNQDLTKELSRLGSGASQEDLDKLGRRYFAHHHGQGVFEEAQDRIASQVKDILTLLRDEQTSLQQYGKVLGDTSVKIGKPNGGSDALLDQIVKLLSEATHSTIDHGKKVVVSMNEKSAEIKKINSELERYKKLANTDPLTKLANRRAFDSHIAEVHGDKKAAMYSSLIFADIDHFKRINDTYGHIVGDKILSYVAGILSRTSGDDAFVARIGGEEFAIAHADTTEKAACDVAEQVRVAVEEKKFINNKSGVDYGPVTVSLGVCMGSEADDATDLFRKTDQALYASKNSGRNRVTRFSEIPPGNGKAFKDWLLYRKQ
ncbi:GGDEF domain-containing protein [Nitratireductor sp. XY-223]|uniref:GGDEF domain-containing protein n=1 Tax=Nitratireductor sp. XY-223 TaxID=2561926 RepID=UPI0010AA9240|nr:GGDEF domain-containing protein [Nitratireductor sp. XY-223]